MSDPQIHRVWRVGEHWCVVGDNGLAFYVGYVSLPENHPWYHSAYDDIPADVHGGLTFGDERDWKGWGADGAPPGFYIGFDCGHWNDAPIPGSYMAGLTLYQDLEDFFVWDVDLVAAEVNRLAVQCQVAAVAAGAGV